MARFYVAALVLVTTLAATAQSPDANLRLHTRSRLPSASADKYDVVEKDVTWNPKQSALIVCDVWDAHHCLNAVRRLDEMLPRMNQVLEKARSQGVLIIHAPSSCMAPYEGQPARERARKAPQAQQLPVDIDKWCRWIPAEEKDKYPIEQTDSEDDDPKEHADWHAKLAAEGRNPKAPWKAQHAAIKIYDQDAISDSGVEIWNLLTERGIDNVVLLGVHTNMCVLGRPFGLRQLAKNGKNVVLMRDMTDTMYNPKQRPYVSHFKGTDLIVEHIEKYVCPTITSDQLIGGQPFRFKGQ
jgi:nicotinamidase-related amidase